MSYVNALSVVLNPGTPFHSETPLSHILYVSGRVLIIVLACRPPPAFFFFFFHSNPASSCTFKVSSAGSAEEAWASADASLASYSRQRNGPTLVLSQGLVHGQVRWASAKVDLGVPEVDGWK